MKDRLVELLDNATVEKTQCYPNGIPALMYCEKAVNRNTAIQLADKILADGWIRPSYKVGNVVYALWETPTLYTETKYILYCAEVKEIRQFKRNDRIVSSYLLEPVEFRGRRREYFDYDFGKTVFLTREEAEAKLKEGVK